MARPGKEIRDRVQTRAHAQTRSVLVRQGPESARRIMIRVLDDEIRRLPAVDRGPLACRAGCDMCCHLRVMVTPTEVFGLLDFLGAVLSEAAFDGFRSRVLAAHARVAALPPDKVLATNVPCPLLVDGSCIGYAARPFNCRSYHSLDRDACQQAFDHPERGDSVHPQLAALARVHEGAQGGFIHGLSEAGFDVAQHELVSALRQALDDPSSRDRFESRRRVFLEPSPV